jgi:hypothetical protein
MRPAGGRLQKPQTRPRLEAEARTSGSAPPGVRPALEGFPCVLRRGIVQAPASGGSPTNRACAVTRGYSLNEIGRPYRVTSDWGRAAR